MNHTTKGVENDSGRARSENELARKKTEVEKKQKKNYIYSRIEREDKFDPIFEVINTIQGGVKKRKNVPWHVVGGKKNR